MVSSGVALALNEIQCKTDIKCVGTGRVDLMDGTDGFNAMYGLGRNDFLYGYGGNDELNGGRGADLLNGGTGDDTLKGGRGGEAYIFDSSWGHDTIMDTAKAATRSTPLKAINMVYFEFEPNSPITNLTIDLNSDSGPVPEMTDGVNTVNWGGDVIAIVQNTNPGNDTIAGNDQANDIRNVDGLGSDTIGGGGGSDYLLNINEGNVSDTVDGGPGNDFIYSLGGSEEGTTHPDKVLGGDGNDYISVDDGAGGDTVECGPGTDTVRFDEGDVLLIPYDCERQNP